MKRAIIGAGFYIGGAILLGTGDFFGLFGLVTAFAGMVIMIFELLSRDR